MHQRRRSHCSKCVSARHASVQHDPEIDCRLNSSGHHVTASRVAQHVSAMCVLVLVCRFQVHVKGDRTITLGIWDTAGAEQFQSLSCLYYRASRAAVICFDSCSRFSFEKLQFWVSCSRVTLHRICCRS